MRQQYISGRYFRSRYIKLHLLPETWDPSTTYFRSTSLERSLSSTLSFYSGLYSPDLFRFDASQFHNIELPIETSFMLDEDMIELWVPHGPAIYTMNGSSDSLLYSYKKIVCPSIKNFRKENWMKDKAKDLAEQGLLGEEVRKHPYSHMASRPDLVKLGTHNVFLQVIDYFKLALAKSKKEARKIVKRIEYRDPAYKLFESWRSHNPDAGELQLVVYGSHDTMIVSLINGMGMKLDKRVSVSSVISFELFLDDDNNPLVEVRFNRELLQLSTCKRAECSLDEFVKAVKKYGIFKSEEEYFEKCQYMTPN